MELEVGSIVSGRVTGITKFGAFVALEGGRSGLVHISEISGSYVNDIHDFLADGQEVQVKILSVSPEGKINLSIKQAQSAPASRPRPAIAVRKQVSCNALAWCVQLPCPLPDAAMSSARHDCWHTRMFE